MPASLQRMDLYLSHAADLGALYIRECISMYYNFETPPLWGSNWNLNPTFIETLKFMNYAYVNRTYFVQNNAYCAQ